MQTLFFNFFTKTSYLNEEVNRTELSPSVRVPWLNSISSIVLRTCTEAPPVMFIIPVLAFPVFLNRRFFSLFRFYISGIPVFRFYFRTLRLLALLLQFFGWKNLAEYNGTAMDNFSWQDKTWAEFSTLEVAVCVCAMQLSCFETKLPNLMLKTRPKQLLGLLPLDIALHGTARIYMVEILT
jgi:hypothetical protein